MVQWLRRRAPKAGGPGSILDQELDPMSKQRVCTPKLKIPYATTETQRSQINKYIF